MRDLLKQETTCLSSVCKECGRPLRHGAKELDKHGTLCDACWADREIRIQEHQRRIQRDIKRLGLRGKREC